MKDIDSNRSEENVLTFACLINLAICLSLIMVNRGKVFRLDK